MSASERDEIDVDRAISIAFETFHRFFQSNHKKAVLLEGVEFEEPANEWHITIGFDAGREKESGPAEPLLRMAGNRAVEPIREFRTFILDGADGRLKAMRSSS